MPHYDYRCEHCGHQFEAFQSIKDAPLADCPACREPRLQRLIGAGAGLLFKGSGFYATDYRGGSGAAAPAGAAESGAACTPTGCSKPGCPKS